MEDATLLGLPSIQFIKEIEGSSWDASVYAGLHQFHQTKGFNPESQEVALHLGYPLYEIDVPFVHVDEDREEEGPGLVDIEEKFGDGQMLASGIYVPGFNLAHDYISTILSSPVYHWRTGERTLIAHVPDFAGI
ncbi:hypothetical protein B0H14DRAFT_2611438 [Mycena olivaceomarginata]|nr:hypothetical protein B0H14DRAFT_2611438 [Mycena olivaceomarginata]